MNICIYGTGGIGGAVGGLLCKYADTRNDLNIYFIARGNHLQEMRTKGLLLQLQDNKTIQCDPDGAESDIKNIPKPDVVFLCVKAYDLVAAIDNISEVITSDMILIPLLNGFDIYERIRDRVKNGYVLPACIYLGGRKLADGKCGIYGPPGMIFYGADPQRTGSFQPKIHSLLSNAFDGSFLNIKWMENPYPAIWQKYIFNVAVNLMNAFSGKTLGEILADTELRQKTAAILKETAEIVKKTGAPVAPDIEQTVWELILRLPCNTISSYALDIKNHMPFNEGELFGKAIIDLGRKVNVKAETIEGVYSEIEMRVQRSRGA